MRTEGITIKEAQSLRDTLEAEISDLIKRFEHETGLRVQDEIKLERPQTIGTTYELLFVHVELKL